MRYLAAIPAALLALTGCLAVRHDPPPLSPGQPAGNRHVLRFAADFVDPHTGQYRQHPLEQLAGSTARAPTNGNRDHTVDATRPGVLRLGVTGECSHVRPETGDLCAVRSEIGLEKGERPPFRESIYYGIRLNLAGAGGGASNAIPHRGYTERLMLAQVKVSIADQTPAYPLDFSPIMALRFEDDQLYVTTEILSPGVTEPPGRDGRCRRGLIGYQPGRPAGSFQAPYRLLLAWEAGGGHDDLPWEFAPERNPATRFACLVGLRTSGAETFPRQPRDRFFPVVMHIDGRSRDDAHVAFYIAGRFVACVEGDIGDRVIGERHYFKFGIYGDLPAGRRLAVDYADFRQAPTRVGIGLGGAKIEDRACRV
jgi:hypothetical protein